MARALSLLLAQLPPLPAGAGVREFGDAAAGLVASFPDAQLVVFPEYHLCWVAGSTAAEREEAWRRAAEPLDGPRLRGLAALARSLKRWLLPGTVPERGPRGELWNTAVLLSPEGELAGAYRKLFPWRPFEPWTPGADFCVVPVPGVGRLGLSICYDVWYPEVFRSLAWLGAEVFLNVSLTSTCDRPQERLLAQAHAVANQAFFVNVNGAWPPGAGRSAVIDPEGRVRVSSEDASPIVLTDRIDLDEVRRVREHGTCALNRLWHQWRDGDPVLTLPAYEGRLDPARWAREGPGGGGRLATS